MDVKTLSTIIGHGSFQQFPHLNHASPFCETIEPYQIMTSYFLLLLLVVSCFPYSLRRSLSTIFFTVSCRSLLPPARCGFLVTVAVFVSASVCSLICYKKEKRDRCRHQSLERMHYHPFVLHCHYMHVVEILSTTFFIKL